MRVCDTHENVCEVRSERAVRSKMCVQQVSVCTHTAAGLAVTERHWRSLERSSNLSGEPCDTRVSVTLQNNSEILVQMLERPRKRGTRLRQLPRKNCGHASLSTI